MKGGEKKTGKSLCNTVHPYAGELLIISVLFQIDQMSTTGVADGLLPFRKNVIQEFFWDLRKINE